MKELHIFMCSAQKENIIKITYTEYDLLAWRMGNVYVAVFMEWHWLMILEALSTAIPQSIEWELADDVCVKESSKHKTKKTTLWDQN